MKKFYLGFGIIALTIISCTDEGISNYEPATSEKYTMLSKTANELLPQNSENPYDIAGSLYLDIFTLYPDADSNASIEEIVETVESISLGNSDFVALQGTAINSVDTVMVNNIISNPKGSLNQIIGSSSLTSGAKSSLTGFIDEIEAIESEDYQEVYSYIQSYEALVLVNNSFTANDKRVLLSTSSIARYSLYDKKRPRDRDWETSVGNIIAATGGAINTTALAIKTAVVTDIGIKP